MDLKNDENSLKFREQQSFTSRYFDSNAGHLFVNNVNPFSSIENYGGNVEEKPLNNRRNDEFIDLYDNTATKPPNNTPSMAFVNEIMKKYPCNNMFMSETYEDIHEALIAGNQTPDRRSSLQPNMSMSATLFDTQYVSSCSRVATKSARLDHQVRFKDYNKDNNRHRLQAFSSNEMMTDSLINEKGQAEKTTYCRPLLNMYNQEFVYKTMQKNARLQKLVRKLVYTREREKQRESWNNYINDLKNKHRYYSNEPSRISPQYVPEDVNTTPEMIDDYYNTRFSWRQSNPCQHLLQDFYENYNNTTPSSYNRYPHDYNIRSSDARPYHYESNPYCYPTSSQANLIRLNMVRQGNSYAHEWRNRPTGRFFRGNTIVADKERKDIFDKIQGTSRPHLRCARTTKNCVCKNKMCSLIRSSSIPIQTDYSLPLVNEEDDKDDQFHQKQETFKDKFKRVTENIAKLKSKVRKSDDDTRRQSLAKIEGKIDGLINSINAIMVDMKSKKKHYRNCKSASVSCRFITTSHNSLNKRNKSDPYGLMKSEDYFCGMLRNSSRSLTISEMESNEITRHKESSISKIDKILLEEIKKSNKVKKDIEELLNLRNDKNCSVQITFDIPTKERSTEVTDSLAKAKLKSRSNVVVEELRSEPTADGRHTQMTIAVNTDPLGLLALLRVSTETVKQFLSYMPNLNYNSYLSMLQLPSKRCVSHYICNICGAAFGRPSQLSDHIEQHNLGRTRDCCVCRHSLDMQHAHVGLFACRYCGQRFTRAYCCELHQQSCARRLGRSHDINSGHILLR